MQLSAVILARYLAFVEIFDLNPRGKVFYPALVEALVKEFNFLKFPQKLEEFDEQKGVEFLAGKWGETAIEKLTIYSNGILLDTRSSTADSERIVEEGLLWAASNLGIEYRTGMIRRKGYLSQLTFYSETRLLAVLNDALSNLADRTGKAVGQILGEDIECEPGTVSINYDPPRRIPVAPFAIHRRLETAFSDNKYYSEAPLPTELHWELLQQFEAELMANSAPKKS